MDEKNRLRELIDIFSGLVTDGDNEGVIFELNGYEGLLVWAPNGRFYQLSYKNADTWNVTMFPYDIYGKREWERNRYCWKEKCDGKETYA